MQIETTDLPGALVLTPRRFGDARGWFSESWNAATLRAQGIDLDFVQDNHSFSAERGTLRGLHYQRPPQAQAKLVRCTRGAVWDVAVDIRPGSASYGRWAAVELSAENHRQFLIPVGFLHGFLTLTEGAEVQYKCTAPYAPDCDGAVIWDDPDLAIAWPFAPVSLSDKDRGAPRLSAIGQPFATGAA